MYPLKCGSRRMPNIIVIVVVVVEEVGSHRQDITTRQQPVMTANFMAGRPASLIPFYGNDTSSSQRASSLSALALDSHLRNGQLLFIDGQDSLPRVRAARFSQPASEIHHARDEPQKRDKWTYIPANVTTVHHSPWQNS